MITMPTEQPIKVYTTSNRSMFCERCGGHTVSAHTRLRFYSSGRQTEVNRCGDCGRLQEIEYWGNSFETLFEGLA